MLLLFLISQLYNLIFAIHAEILHNINVKKFLNYIMQII